MQKIKLIIYVPVSHTKILLDALGNAGAGQIGNYTHCSFTTRGTGRFLGNEKSNPAIGEKGVLESVEEDRVEVTVERSQLDRVISAMKSVHPYEEIAFDIYPLEDLS